jgi:hypothetical protein
MSRSVVTIARRVLVLGTGTLAGLAVFTLLRSPSDSPRTAPAASSAAELVEEELRREHEVVPVAESFTMGSIVLDDGQVVDVVEEIVMPDGSVVPATGTAEQELPIGAPSSTAPAGTSPAPTVTSPTTTVPSSRDRIEELKRTTPWPAPPSLPASYLGSYWNVVDVPATGVLLVTKVHEWVFTPGDSTIAQRVVAQLESAGWSGLAASADAEGTYGVASNSIPGCGDGMDCSVQVRSSSGEVLLFLERVGS